MTGKKGRHSNSNSLLLALLVILTLSISDSGEDPSDPLTIPVAQSRSFLTEEKEGPEELSSALTDPVGEVYELDVLLEGDGAPLNLTTVALSPRPPVSSDPRRTHFAAGSEETAQHTIH